MTNFVGPKKELDDQLLNTEFIIVDPKDAKPLRDDFEFYRDLKREPKAEDFNDPFGLRNVQSKDFEINKELESCPKKIEKIEKTPVQRKKMKATAKTRSIKIKATIAVIYMLIGFGAHSLVSYVKPYVKSYKEFESDRKMVASLSDSYRVTQEGHLKSLDLKYKKQGLFYDGPGEIDFENSENVRLNANGDKVGYAVDYYDGLDEYISLHNNGEGYYETIYEMNKNAEKLGMKPLNAGPYTPEELEKMIEKTTEKDLSTDAPSLGGK